MSFKKNVVASYASQAYTTLIGIAMMPVYIRYMGAEAYGLIGFFAMLQVCFQLLDVGLTPTMARQSARYQGGAVDGLSVRRTLRAFEVIFFGMALLGSCAMIVFAQDVSEKWLKVEDLPLMEVKHAIIIMAIVVALRWVSGLYRGSISGFEHLIWLSGFNVLASTARFILVIPFFIYVGSSPTYFFGYQLGVALIETTILIIETYLLLPKINTDQKVDWQWQPLRNVLKFSLGIAFTRCIWILATQTDKLLLSTLLSLTGYGHFTLAVLVASGVMIIGSPISAALGPRLTMLLAKGDNAGMIVLYRNATQLVGVISVSAAMILAFFSEQVLWAWTGDRVLAKSAAPILTLYALGNGIVSLASFPYYLQFAKGDLKLHIIGNATFVLLLIPTLILAAIQYGAIGTGYAWLFSNLAYFLFWIPKIHNRFSNGLHLRWLMHDLAGIVLLALVCTSSANYFVTWSEERAIIAVEILLFSMVSLIIVATASQWVRNAISNKIWTQLNRSA